MTRNQKGQFVKGASGNPGGRPKQIQEVVELAREHTPEALQTMLDIMRSGDSDEVRLRAAALMLERGWGKAALPILHKDMPQPVFHINVIKSEEECKNTEKLLPNYG